jgi:aryl-alcohol dehydrogenase-like predicted oxidoreductase
MRYSRRAADEAGITLFDAADMYPISALTVLREGVVRRQEHDVTVRSSTIAAYGPEVRSGAERRCLTYERHCVRPTPTILKPRA